MVKKDPFFSSSDQEDLPIALPCSYNPLPDGPPADDSPASVRRPIAWVVLFFSSFLVICFLVAIIGEIRSESHADVNGSFSTPPTSVAPETLLPMSRGVSAGVSEKANLQLPSFPWNNSMLSWQRTAFHFQPGKNWMNDPNGPLWHKGWYHLFYQYNPNGAVWGNIVWGHAVSSNLIHWLLLPFALIPDQWYDINGVFTGSATVFPDGQIVVLYTGATKESVQVQNLAFPQNLSDPLLLNWVKYPRNPVLVPPPGIHFKDFRDPTTAWLTSDGKWRFTIGSKVGRTGISLLYETQDFQNYKLLDGLLHAVSGTGMWECVDFFPVSVSANNGLDTSVQGPGVKHVIKASFDDDRHDYYSIGTYDESSGTWFPDDRNFDIGNGFRYDYGLFYASKTFYDQNRKRRILWGWIGESDSQYADIQKGWASVQSIPRTLLLDMKTGRNLLQWPVEEVESLRLTSHRFENLEVKAGSVLPLNIGLATQLDIIAEFELDEEDLKRASQSNSKFSCSTSRGAAERGTLGPFGLLVLADDILSESTSVYFYVAKGENDNLETFICSDQSKSSKANDVIKPIYGSSVPVLKGEKFSLRILVDHSIVESFAQGGRACITSRVYPTKALYGAARLFVFNNATGADVKVSLSIWQMNSADIRPFHANAEKQRVDICYLICALLFCLKILYFQDPFLPVH